jgi:parallel beta-helix repeat protein
MFLAIILMGVLGASFNVHKVEAQLGTIYIRADGSIYPSTANITTLDNVTYTLTGNNYLPIVVNRSNIIINGEGYTVQGEKAYSSTGINLTQISNVTIKNMKIASFYHGVYLSYSYECTVWGNDITSNENGIVLYVSNYNSIGENDIEANSKGIWFFYASNHNNVIGNNIANNYDGIEVQISDFNMIVGNNITGSTSGYGVFVYVNTLNNTFYHNNFLNNAHNAGTFPGGEGVIIWDNGYPFGGNYWSNYGGVDADMDGIGDSSYEIGSMNIDHYPLMGMFSSFNTSLGLYVDVISNSTIEDFEYFESNSTIIMHVSNMTSGQTFGFCRIRIPHALMNETYHVTIDGTEPYYVNYTLYDDGENRWIYFNYQHSTLEIVIIPEFPSFLILLLFMIVSVLVITIHKVSKRKRARAMRH